MSPQEDAAILSSCDAKDWDRIGRDDVAGGYETEESAVSAGGAEAIGGRCSRLACQGAKNYLLGGGDNYAPLDHLLENPCLARRGWEDGNVRGKQIM